MADRDTYNDDTTTTNTGAHNAAPNHGIDGNNDHDATKGGIGGAIGGAIVGALAGGPVGAVIGAIAGGAASAAGVAAVDRHDHDGSPADTTATGTGTSASFIGNNSDTVPSAPASAAYKGNDTYATDNTYATTPAATTTGYNTNVGANTVADGTVIPIVEEELEVGKRQVQSGGVRINQTVEEVPVSEQVSLHEEHVTIDRRPVDRAVGAGDTAFQDGVYEVTETNEVPVVAKTARVVEEVVVGKTASDHVETVNDTVRRTDVDVEQIPGSTTTTGTDYRTDVNR